MGHWISISVISFSLRAILKVVFWFCSLMLISRLFQRLGREYKGDFLKSSILGFGIVKALALRRLGMSIRSLLNVQILMNELGQ